MARGSGGRAPSRLAGTTLAVMKGGPLDGAWYTEADHLARREAAIRMGYDKHHPAGVALGYRKTQGRRDSPLWPEEHGIVWKWTLPEAPPLTARANARTGARSA